MDNIIISKKANLHLEDNESQDSLAISIGILADMTRKELERSLLYFDINCEKQALKTSIK